MEWLNPIAILCAATFAARWFENGVKNFSTGTLPMSTNIDPMTDLELDHSPEGLLEQEHSSTSIPMEDILENFTSYASTPAAEIVLAQIEELELKAARADHPVEVHVRCGLERKVKELQRLLVQTVQGVATIDALAPRIDLSFLKLGMLQLMYGWLPRFAVFTSESTTCYVDLTTIRNVGWVTNVEWSQSPLGQFFKVKWPFQPFSLLKNLLLCLVIGAMLGLMAGSLLGYFTQAVSLSSATILGGMAGAVGNTVLYFARALLKNERVTLTLETRLQQVLTDEIRDLLPVLKRQFNEVLLIVPANEWRELDGDHQESATIGMYILVVVGRADNYWLAAYAHNSLDKKSNSRMFLSILDPDTHRQVHTLNLNFSGIADEEFCRRLGTFESPNDLRHLYLFNAKITDAGLAHLSSLPHLQELNLAHARMITDAGLGHLSNLASLQELNLSSTNVTDAGLARLSNLTNLQSLDLSGVPITDAGFSHLSNLTNLRSLNLSHTKITKAGLVLLRNLTNLRSLNLQGNITDDELVCLSGLTNLQSLNLAGTKISNAGLAYLNGLTDLRSLNLGYTRISNGGLAHLSRLTNLQTLSLQFTKVTEAGFVHLRSLINLREIRFLSSRITNTGVIHLSRLTELQTLDLRGAKFTEAGLAHLSSLTNLKALRLGNIDITEPVLKSLQEALPHCKISRT